MDKREMLMSLIDRYAGGSKSRFAEMVGVTRQCLTCWLDRGNFDPELIYKACPGVSAKWLLSNGKGSMTETVDSRSVVDTLIDRIQALSVQLEIEKNRK